MSLEIHIPSELHTPMAVEEIRTAYPDIRCFLLEGDLGAGKTTFVKAFCDVLGIEEPVSSPTFTIVNSYEGNGIKVNHFDLYRLKNTSELADIGFEEILYEDAYVFIEWPELALPLVEDVDYVLLTLTHAPNNTRSISANLHKGI